MERIVVKLLIAGIVLTSLWLTGCGDDTYQGDYTTKVTFTDADEDDILTIDVFQNPDCDGDVSTNDPEFYTDVFANITVTVDEFSPGLKINGYTIEYYPETSEDGTNNLVLPPTLSTIADQGNINIHIASATSEPLTITCFSVDQKEDYLTKVTAAYPNLEVSRYTIRIILLCRDDNGRNKNLEIRRTVYLGPYNNC